MTLLILGLVVFLGTHAVRIVADDWRTAQIARWGPLRWKAAYSLVSLIGLVLIIVGYGMARAQPIVLWTPPSWGRYAAAVLTAAAFILFPAAHAPGNGIKAIVGHPMILAVQLWAVGHLLANGTLAAVVLFGAFLAWGVVDFIAAWRREPAPGLVTAPRGMRRTVMPAIGGLIVWALFAFVLHGWLIGVRPFNR